ncbi:protein PF3D7_1417600-like [Prorops nasuta]|uniref:protein PF3D7_1417600-like n=1 Tax=Prorops nasuta TaxID=863751 RepID=UPI0034CDF3B3
MYKILVVFLTIVTSGLFKSIDVSTNQNRLNDARQYGSGKYSVSPINQGADFVSDKEKSRVMFLVPVDEINKNENDPNDSERPDIPRPKIKRCKAPELYKKIRTSTNSENKPTLQAKDANYIDTPGDYGDSRPIVQFLLKNPKIARNPMLGSASKGGNNDYEEFLEALRYEVGKLNSENEITKRKPKNENRKYSCYCEEESEKGRKPPQRPIYAKQYQPLRKNKGTKDYQRGGVNNLRVGMPRNTNERVLPEDLAVSNPAQVAHLIPILMEYPENLPTVYENIDDIPVAPILQEIPSSFIGSHLVGTVRNMDNSLKNQDPGRKLSNKLNRKALDSQKMQHLPKDNSENPINLSENLQKYENKEDVKIVSSDTMIESRVNNSELTNDESMINSDNAKISTESDPNIQKDQYIFQAPLRTTSPAIENIFLSTTGSENYPQNHINQVPVVSSTVSNLYNDDNINVYSTTQGNNDRHEEVNENFNNFSNGPMQQSVQFSDPRHYSTPDYNIESNVENNYPQFDGSLKTGQEIVGLKEPNIIETTLPPRFDVGDQLEDNTKEILQSNMKLETEKPLTLKTKYLASPTTSFTVENSDGRSNLKEEPNNDEIKEVIDSYSTSEMFNKETSPYTINNEFTSNTTPDIFSAELTSPNNLKNFDKINEESTTNKNSFVNYAERKQSVGKSKCLLTLKQFHTEPSVIDSTEITPDEILGITERSMPIADFSEDSSPSINEDKIKLTEKSISDDLPTTYDPMQVSQSVHSNVNDLTNIGNTKQPNSYFRETEGIITQPEETYPKQFSITPDPSSTTVEYTDGNEDNSNAWTFNVDDRGNKKNEPDSRNLVSSINSSENQLPFCDNSLLLSAIKQSLNSFSSKGPSSDVVGAPEDKLVAEVTDIPNVKDFFSLPQIERAVVNKVKNLLRNVHEIPAERLLPHWVTNAIKNTFKSIMPDGAKTNGDLPPMTVEEHQMKDGKWLTNLVTLAPVTDEEHDSTLSENIRKKLEQLVYHPLIGLETAKKQIVQNILVEAVRNDFPANDDQVNDSTVRKTLKDIIDKYNSARSNDESLDKEYYENEESKQEGIDERLSVSQGETEKDVLMENNENNMKQYLDKSVGLTRDIIEGELPNVNNNIGAKKIISYAKAEKKNSSLFQKAKSLQKSIRIMSTTDASNVPSEEIINEKDYGIVGETPPPALDNIDPTSTNDKVNTTTSGLLEEPIQYYSPDNRVLNYIKTHPANSVSNVLTEDPTTRTGIMEDKVKEDINDRYELGTPQYTTAKNDPTTQIDQTEDKVNDDMNNPYNVGAPRYTTLENDPTTQIHQTEEKINDDISNPYKADAPRYTTTINNSTTQIDQTEGKVNDDTDNSNEVGASQNTTTKNEPTTQIDQTEENVNDDLSDPYKVGSPQYTMTEIEPTEEKANADINDPNEFGATRITTAKQDPTTQIIQTEYKDNNDIIDRHEVGAPRYSTTKDDPTMQIGQTEDKINNDMNNLYDVGDPRYTTTRNDPTAPIELTEDILNNNISNSYEGSSPRYTTTPIELIGDQVNDNIQNSYDVDAPQYTTARNNTMEQIGQIKNKMNDEIIDPYKVGAPRYTTTRSDSTTEITPTKDQANNDMNNPYGIGTPHYTTLKNNPTTPVEITENEDNGGINDSYTVGAPQYTTPKNDPMTPIGITENEDNGDINNFYEVDAPQNTTSSDLTAEIEPTVEKTNNDMNNPYGIGAPLYTTPKNDPMMPIELTEDTVNNDTNTSYKVGSPRYTTTISNPTMPIELVENQVIDDMNNSYDVGASQYTTIRNDPTTQIDQTENKVNDEISDPYKVGAPRYTATINNPTVPIKPTEDKVNDDMNISYDFDAAQYTTVRNDPTTQIDQTENKINDEISDPYKVGAPRYTATRNDPTTPSELMEDNGKISDPYEGGLGYNDEDNERNATSYSISETEGNLKHPNSLSEPEGRLNEENSYGRGDLVNKTISEVMTPYTEGDYGYVNENSREGTPPFESKGGEIVSAARETPEDFTYLGRIAMKDRKNNANGPPSLQNSDLYYIGDGVRLPLEIKKLEDGSYALSISERVCEHIMNRRCPCCVPRQGNIVQTRKRYANLAQKNKAIDNKNDNNVFANSRIARSPKENAGMRKVFNLIENSGDTVTSMPVEVFAKKYNLSLSANDDATTKNEGNFVLSSDYRRVGDSRAQYRNRAFNRYLNVNEDFIKKDNEDITENSNRKYFRTASKESGPYRRNIVESPSKGVVVLENLLNWLKGAILRQ